MDIYVVSTHMNYEGSQEEYATRINPENAIRSLNGKICDAAMNNSKFQEDMYLEYWNKYQSRYITSDFAKEYFIKNVELTSDELEVCNRLTGSLYNVFDSFVDGHGYDYHIICTKIQLVD